MFFVVKSEEFENDIRRKSRREKMFSLVSVVSVKNTRGRRDFLLRNEECVIVYATHQQSTRENFRLRAMLCVLKTRLTNDHL